ncbi:hypothetical protein H8959_017065, partial [Pygathrix nigripes]
GSSHTGLQSPRLCDYALLRPSPPHPFLRRSLPTSPVEIKKSRNQPKVLVVPERFRLFLRRERGTEAQRGKATQPRLEACQQPYQVWNAVDSGHCLQTYSLHTEAVRAARWAPCGRRILSGGFDFALHLTDLETGTQLFSGRSDFRITTLKFHPKDHNIFLCGGFSSEMKAWDIRTGKERFTCPSLALHPREPVFLAQTNGNYLALFSTVWPYRMSRRRRYEGHKVEGYSVGCECSPGGDLLVTGSADGRVLMYSFRTASRACTLQGHTQACVGTTYHPVLPSVLATCSWGGDMKIWH